MRTIFFGIVVLLASTAAVHAVQADKHVYAQAFINRRQPMPISREQLIGVDQVHPDEDVLTKRIEQDKTRLDRLIDICPSC